MAVLIIAIIILSTFLATFSSIIGKKIGLMDAPKEGKIHSKPIPMIGGLILFFSILISLIFNEDLVEQEKFILFFYFSSFFLVGFLDDKYNIDSYIRIFLILSISIIFIFSYDFFVIEKIFFKNLNSEYYFGKFKIIVTLICILLLYIAMNMADGINGLIILFSIIGIIIFKYFISLSSLNFIDIAILTSLIVLFFFNYNNKLFLGNSGTTLLASYFIFTSIEQNYFLKIDVFSIISIFLIMGIDMVRLFFLRISNNSNPFNRDQEHFHHILFKKYNTNFAISIYIFLSFSPIIFSKILNLSIIIFIIFSVLLYFTILLKNKKNEKIT